MARMQRVQPVADLDTTLHAGRIGLPVCSRAVNQILTVRNALSPTDTLHLTNKHSRMTDLDIYGGKLLILAHDLARC
jgi:hypothetical protein